MGESIRIIDKRKRRFTIIDNSVLESTQLDAYEKLTYILLCKFSNHELQACFPSLNTLMNLVGCSKPKIIKCLKKLEEMKYIEIEHRRKGNENISNLYYLIDIEEITDKRSSNLGLPPSSNRDLPGSKLGLPELDTINNTNNINQIDFEKIDDLINYYSKKFSIPFQNTLNVYDRCIKQQQECNIEKGFTIYFEKALENEKNDYKLTKFIIKQD